MKPFLFCFIVIFLSNFFFTQVKVGDNPTNINGSAALEIESSTKGFLPPRITSIQRDAISNPSVGLLIYNTTTNCMEYYRPTGWYSMCPRLATLTTVIASSITGVSASSGGQITDDGGATITSRGVCWSMNPNPTLSNSFTSDGIGSGTFNSVINSLQNGTTYYVRAYATTSVGTAYGNEIVFTTLNIPTLSTSSVTLVYGKSATSGGNVTSDGGAAVASRGLCWSTTQNPTIANSVISSGTGIGSFSLIMSGLNYSTIYYVRAFATNSVGTAYGNQVSFTTTAGTVVSFTTTGTNSWAVPIGVNSIDATIVGGGGGGGADVGGGGGGGQVLNVSNYGVTSQSNLTILVAQTTGYPPCYNCAGQNGNSSSISGGSSTQTALGGVGGRGRAGSGGSNVGWNGGGGSYDFNSGFVGNGGYSGGNAFPGKSCGGGGGSGSMGVAATSNKAGNGGIGLASIINNQLYGGGGGGGEYASNGNYGDGFNGGGIGGYNNSINNIIFGQDGLPNTGGGGGGGPSTASMNNAGRGASGIVLIKY